MKRSIESVQNGYEEKSPHKHTNKEQIAIRNKCEIMADKTNVQKSNSFENPRIENVHDGFNKINSQLPNYYPGIQGSRAVAEFEFLNRVQEGTYGVVFRARNRRTNEIVALKRLKVENEEEGFPQTSLREINMLLKAQHPNIVTVREIVVGFNLKHVYIVMDYIEQDISSLMQTMKRNSQVFSPSEVKCLLQQLLGAVKHLHANWIIHRDLKTSNLLLSHQGILKVADFGMSREYGSPLERYTTLVVTRWYRAPELLLGSMLYSTPIDIWSIGCIFAELLLMTPYLPGKSDIDQINLIFSELGTPNDQIWRGYNELPAVKNIFIQHGNRFNTYSTSNMCKRFRAKVNKAGILLLKRLFTYDPEKRITAEDALKHIYFEELPKPTDLSLIQMRVSQHEKNLLQLTTEFELNIELCLKF